MRLKDGAIQDLVISSQVVLLLKINYPELFWYSSITLALEQFCCKLMWRHRSGSFKKIKICSYQFDLVVGDYSIMI